MISLFASGTGCTSTTDQRRAPRRTSLSNTERGCPEYQGTKKACLANWDVSSVGCSFGDGQKNHGALTEVNRVSKKAVKRSSAGQGILGKVKEFCLVNIHIFYTYYLIQFSVTVVVYNATLSLSI